jgi:hypothetical protein
MQVGAQVAVYPNNAPVAVYPNAPSTTADIAAADRAFEARVISSRPVSGPSQQQCYMERQQVKPLELPDVLLGSTVDLLTGKPQSTPYIERCSTVAGTAYWDVTYEFRGVIRRAELATEPSPTIIVNGYGNPRG